VSLRPGPASAVPVPSSEDEERPPGRRRVGVASALILLIDLIVLTQLPALPLTNPTSWRPDNHSPAHLVDLATGSEGGVAVVDQAVADRGINRMLLMNNHYLLGATRAARRQEQLGLIPVLLHPRPRRVAFIGLATGGTAGAALRDEGIEQITAIEISPLVARMAVEHFRELNHHFATDPRTTIVVEDGRTFIAACRDRYDVIVGDLYIPWEAGTGRLYSREHFNAARRALTDGGLFCQWIPMFQITPEQFHVITATFHEAFGHAYLVRDDARSQAPAFGLVGFRNAELDWSVIARRAAQLSAAGRIADPDFADAALVRALYLGAFHPPDRAALPLNTLNNAWVEFAAGEGYISGRWRFLDARSYEHLPRYLAPFAPEAADGPPRQSAQ